MLKINELPVEVADTVASLTNFIRGTNGQLLSYDELIEKFNTDTPDDEDTHFINNEEDDLFDFDYGVLGGTITREEDGAAKVAVVQWYRTPDADDCGLPVATELEIQKANAIPQYELEEQIGDMLSEEYDFCHFGFTYRVTGENTVLVDNIRWDTTGEEPEVIELDVKL